VAVYFIERSFYEGPTGRQLSRVNADTVLSAFQARWGQPPDPNLGVRFLAHVLHRAAEEGLASPQSMEELAAHLPECIYWPQVVVEEHALQVMTDDDEIEMASYVFDDHFRARVPAHFTAFLLHDDWRLPGGAGTGIFVPAIQAAPLLPAGGGEGTTWFILQMAEDTSCLSEMRYPMRIEGVRVPDLGRYLAEVVPAPGEPGGMDWPWELRLLRTQVPDRPTGADALRVALERTNGLNVKHVQRLGEWNWAGLEGDLASARHELAERLVQIEERSRTISLNQPADPALSLIQGEEHVAQLCLNDTAPCARYGRRYESYFQWIFFDDLWAAAHADLATGLLRFASRWDVLSEGERED
jgi:hypothetical protein